MKNRRYDNEFENEHRAFSGPVMLTIGIVSGAILMILIFVFASNNATSGKNNLRNANLKAKATEEPDQTAIDIAANYTDENGKKDIEKLYKDKKLRAEDFDFWDIDNGSGTIRKSHSDDGIQDSTASTDGNLSQNPESETDSETSPMPDISPSPEKEELLKDVNENPLDFTNLKIVNNKMQYSVNNDIVSKLGADVSFDSGVVDFNMLKDNGVDFVMLKVGSRGYDSGLLTSDPNFDRNYKAAKEAGMGIGLYFASRAVNVEEAIEEADFCMNQVMGNGIDYPVAFVFEGQTFDNARTDVLDREGKTKVAEAFLKTIKNRGATPVLYGNEDYILNDIIPDNIIKEFDVYLSNQDSIPIYPYQYNMWKYIKNVVIPGIENPSSYIISFVDYQAR